MLSATPLPYSTSYRWAGYLLGFAMGGFFDGILLHQVLQWHHLLSALESDPFRNLRVQILADGLFHVLMYVLMATGLWKLWQTRHEFDSPRADRFILANFLIGFGAWHLFDGIFSHWVFGIHRINPASNAPLFWDLFFFIGLGVGLVTLGGWIRHQMHHPKIRIHQKWGSSSAAMLLAVTVLTAAIIAAVPWRNSRAVTVLFDSNISTSKVFAAADAVDARLMWSNKAGDIWVFHLPVDQQAWRLYQHGAQFVGGSFFGMGCFTAPQMNI